MSLLTEAEIVKREDIFFELVEDITKEYYPDVKVEPLTEEDAYLLSIMLEHFVENYKNPTLHETYIATMMGQEEPDHNDELYEEIVDILLDESIGSKIATVAHGIQHFLSGRQHAKLAKKSAATAARLNVAKRKAGEYAKKLRGQKKSTGILGSIKTGWQKDRSNVLKSRTAAAKSTHDIAHGKTQAALAKHQDIGAKRAGLAHKIDTGLSNIKKKVTGTIHKGASRLGAAASRVASMFH